MKLAKNRTQFTRMKFLQFSRPLLHAKHHKCFTFLFIIASTSVLVFHLGRVDKTPTDIQPNSFFNIPYYERLANMYVNFKKDNELLRVSVISGLLAQILENQTRIIAESMENSKLHPALKVSNFKELLLENGGKPVRSMVITTWRSGSTFLGDLMQSSPASFYHYEPLLPYGINQIRYGPNATNALRDLHKLMDCNYKNMDHYMQFAKDYNFLMRHNEPFYQSCKKNMTICLTPDFLGAFCKLFPFQNIKTVRLRLNLTRSFLEETKANVLLMIRDPRGTLQSRHHRDFCAGNPDCEDPARLCQDLIDDYHTATKLLKEYPNSFKVIRYEDLSFDIYNQSQIVFDFFHLTYDERIKDFLDSHTTESKGGVSSTFRDSKTVPIHWRQNLYWDEVYEIQNICFEAMTLWGYQFAYNETHLRTMNPIGKLKLNL